MDGPFGKIDLGLHPHGMSNALLVDAAHTADGHPAVVFGPQTGYYAPQLLVEQDLHGPGIDARGVSFAGTKVVVELGHGVDYAWSATSASDDDVDTVIERLCNADGSTPTVDSTSYRVATGACVPMDTYVHTETAIPNVGRQAQPQEIDLQVLRTRHGIVQVRTTVGGVAGRGRARSAPPTVTSSTPRSASPALNDPGYVHDAAVVPAGVLRGRLHVQLVLRRRQGHRLLQLGAAAEARRRRSTRTCPAGATRPTTGRVVCRLRRPPEAINPPTGYLVQLEQQAGARLRRRRQRVGLRPDLPIAASPTG